MDGLSCLLGCYIASLSLESPPSPCVYIFRYLMLVRENWSRSTEKEKGESGDASATLETTAMPKLVEPSNVNIDAIARALTAGYHWMLPLLSLRHRDLHRHHPHDVGQERDEEDWEVTLTTADGGGRKEEEEEEEEEEEPVLMSGHNGQAKTMMIARS